MSQAFQNESKTDAFLRRIASSDAPTRRAAWRGANQQPLDMLRPLVQLRERSHLEVARSVEHAMWRIVRHTQDPALPEADRERLLALLAALLDEAVAPDLQRLLIRMIAETSIGGASAAAVARFLYVEDPRLRLEACMALDYIAGADASEHLRRGLRAAPAESLPAIASALARRRS